MRWDFIDTGLRSGSFNMEFDEALARRIRSDGGAPTLRVYRWTPYTISIGFNQEIADFDLTAIAGAGFSIVRRPTGGRAIFHAHELTYSVVMPVGEDRSLRTPYHFINEGLLEGLRLLGIDAELAHTDERLTLPRTDPNSIPCFSSSAKAEIQFKGKKLVGSAQRRYGHVVLQHGSLLLGAQHRRLPEFFAPWVQCARSGIEEILSGRTIEAETILGRPVTFTEAAECIRRGFEFRHGISFSATSLGEEQPMNSRFDEFSHYPPHEKH